MADSNGAWGELAELDSELASTWDTYSRLPEEGSNVALDALCRSKNISIASLVRQGAKLSDDVTLAFPYPGGIKYRHLATGKQIGRAHV